jgi:type I restriction enzyme S subunit
MKGGWKNETLGDACEMYQPKTISGKDMVENGAYPVYGANGVIGRYNQFNHEEPQLLITCRGATCGSVNISAPRSWVTGNAMVVRPKNGSLELHYLEYLFRGGIDISKAITGAAQPQITRTNLAPLEISYPVSVDEQRRIVDLLDEAFAGIATAKANAEKNLQNARALFESHLQSVFTQRGKGWTVKKVSEISKHSLGKMLDKAKNKGEPQPYLRNINVRWFTFDLSDLLQMPFLPTESEKYTAIKGDVLICEGGYPGRAAIWNEDYPIYFQKALHRVRFHEPEHNKWFVYYLSAQDASGELKKHFNGTGIQHFTGEVLARFEIPLPPLPELQRAVKRFDELSEETRRLAGVYERKLAALAALKKSLLNEAFTGKL